MIFLLNPTLPGGDLISPNLLSVFPLLCHLSVTFKLSNVVYLSRHLKKFPIALPDHFHSFLYSKPHVKAVLDSFLCLSTVFFNIISSINYVLPNLSIKVLH
ncbi:unnamed protein product [Ilex paraguariensis]|uniref:Uncharacterized protein n=1 Tax=Ilex paraguariensis TaxID=185542 RepID=A0ABC8UKH7_9AQUA